ncbi:hypothetical protein B0J18DRAFT_474372 [Chaetomium sp. MPI-SDFR-AT-0129]|nr:hypothetical protein B0J18DRAFT_474372 [Chaetomium sp. MPI-SDFR-AT-0129]
MVDGLDQGLCRWMLDHGARHFSEESPFDNLSFESPNLVLQSKIAGTRNLDAVFHETLPDFFVVFSSALGVAGSTGHSHDTAANLYVTAVAPQRMYLGLVGLAVWLVSAVDNEFVRPLDTDVPQHFTEAPSIGKPECEEVAEISTQPRRIAHRAASNVTLEVQPKVNIQPILAPDFNRCHPKIDERRVSIPSSNASSNGPHEHDTLSPTTAPRLARTHKGFLAELNSPLSPLSNVPVEELDDKAKLEGLENKTESIPTADEEGRFMSRTSTMLWWLPLSKSQFS